MNKLFLFNICKVPTLNHLNSAGSEMSLLFTIALDVILNVKWLLSKGFMDLSWNYYL